MAAEFKVGIGADISELTSKVAQAKSELSSAFKNVDVSGVQKAMGSVADSVGGMGRSVDQSRVLLKQYQQDFKTLVGQGINPAHPEVVKISDEIDKLTKEISEASKPTQELTKSLKEVGQTSKGISELGSQVAGLGAKLSLGITAPFVALTGSALKAHAEVEGVRTAFERLGQPGLLDELRKSTKNTVSDIELMKRTVSAGKFGIPVQELGKLLEYASRTAKDTGQSVDYLVDSIVTGIGRKSPLILDNLGISATALKKELGGVSMEAASVGMVTAAVGKIASKELAKMGADTSTLNEQWLRVKTSMGNAMAQVGSVIAPMLKPIVDLVEKVALGFQNLSPEIQKIAVVIGAVAAAAGPLLVVFGGLMTMLPAAQSGFTILTGAITKAGGAMGLLLNPITLVTIGIVGIVTAVVANWGKITPYLVRTANNFIQLYNESQTFRGGVLSIGFAFESLYAVIKSFAISAYNTLKSFGKGVLSLFEGISEMARGFSIGLNNGDWSMFQSGWTKANAKVALSFDNMGARIDAVESKYNKLLKNDKVKFVTEADLNISTDASTTKTAEQVASELKSKIKNKPIKIELPDIEVISGKGGSAGFRNFLGETYHSMLEFENRMAEIVNRIPDTLGQLSPLVQTHFNALQVTISENIIGLQSQFAQLSDIGNFVGDAINMAFDTVVGTITESFSAMGEAMATGGNVMAAFGEAVLGGIGNFLGELGKQMVQYGVAALAMSVLSKLLLNPITAAPAAIAMIAAGAALSLAAGAIKGTLSGKGGGGSASANAGGGNQSYTSGYSSGGGNGGGTVVFRISGNDLVGVLSKQQDRNTRLNSD